MFGGISYPLSHMWTIFSYKLKLVLRITPWYNDKNQETEPWIKPTPRTPCSGDRSPFIPSNSEPELQVGGRELTSIGMEGNFLASCNTDHAGIRSGKNIHHYLTHLEENSNFLVKIWLFSDQIFEKAIILTVAEFSDHSRRPAFIVILKNRLFHVLCKSTNAFEFSTRMNVCIIYIYLINV